MQNVYYLSIIHKHYYNGLTKKDWYSTINIQIIGSMHDIIVSQHDSIDAYTKRQNTMIKKRNHKGTLRWNKKKKQQKNPQKTITKQCSYLQTKETIKSTFKKIFLKAINTVNK